MIIWPLALPDCRFGHVAIVTGIDEDFVYIGEQNWDDWMWENKWYSRKFKLIKENGTCTVIEDEGY